MNIFLNHKYLDLKGESEISCIRLINLDKLNISMDEISCTTRNKSTKYSFPQLMQYIQEMYQHKIG